MFHKTLITLTLVDISEIDKAFTPLLFILGVHWNRKKRMSHTPFTLLPKQVNYLM